MTQKDIKKKFGPLNPKVQRLCFLKNKQKQKKNSSNSGKFASKLTKKYFWVTFLFFK